MDPQELSFIFTALGGAGITSISRDGADLGVRINHPLFAGRRGEGYTDFILLFKNCTRYHFQPVAQSSALIHNPEEIVRLEPWVDGTEKSEPGTVKVRCRWGGDNKSEGRLFVAASELKVFDEAFDLCTIEDLRKIRK
ncbi:MAG: hypothetical protein H6581_19080 [Bacteroidia bacterium]|nr:hypothetical protein [Bacteroidia bacterium]